jgi:hypothetical protein
MFMLNEVDMARRINWQRTTLDRKRRYSISDEKEFMESDAAAAAAARWLERQEKRQCVKSLDKVKTEATKGRSTKHHR